MNISMQSPKKSHRGFTLVELMIVLAIVAIIAGVAYPSYKSYVLKTHRKVAIGEVLDTAAHLSRIKSQRFSFSTGTDGEETIDLERYELTVTTDSDTFTISAVPKSVQEDDKCGTFTYNNESVWTFENSLTESECLD